MRESDWSSDVCSSDLFIKAIQNPDHERHEEFDPEAFDPAAATKAMKKG